MTTEKILISHDGDFLVKVFLSYQDELSTRKQEWEGWSNDFDCWLAKHIGIEYDNVDSKCYIIDERQYMFAKLKYS